MKLRSLLNTSLIFILVGIGPLAYSAEEEIQNTTESTQESSQAETSTNEEENEAPSAPTEDTFIPSTQISEDLSVSFPVNI